jgi:ribosomal protein S10
VRVEAGEVYFTFKAFDKTLLRQFTERLAQKALALQLDCFSVVPLPTRIRRWTVLSSPFVDKEARSQFEMRVHKRLVVVQTRALERRLDPSRFDHWAAQARIHRMIEVFMRFMPGIQVTFHHKIIRRV